MRSSNRLGTIGLTILICLIGLGFGLSYAKAQTPNQEQLEQGTRLYVENCAVCHGEMGEGRVGATLVRSWPSIRPDLSVRTTIENGISGSVMPAWSQASGGPFTDEEIDALVVYILSWEPGGPRVIPPTPTAVSRPVLMPVPGVEGDPNNGALVYDQNCAVCHGSSGEGRIGAALARSWPSIRPDLSIKNTIENGIPGSTMPAWSQANGGPLSDSEINDVVAFVMTFSETPAQAMFTPTPTPTTTSVFSSGFGVVLTILLFILIVGVALYVQSRDSDNEGEE